MKRKEVSSRMDPKKKRKEVKSQKNLKQKSRKNEKKKSKKRESEKRGNKKRGFKPKQNKRIELKEEIRTGKVKRHPDGFGFLVPDDGFKKDIYVPKDQMRGVMGNDRLKVLVKPRGYGNYFYAKVLEILERNTQSVSGKLHRKRKNLYTISDASKSWGEDLKIYSLPKTVSGTDWVLADILTYPGSPEGFTGQIKKGIKNPMDSSMDTLRILYSQNIPYEFDSQAMEEAKSLPDEVRREDLLNRKDLRHLNFITIDGSTARDFDDAIYVTEWNNESKKSKGEDKRKKTKSQNTLKKGFKLYVAIADVSYYVKPGSALDKEAYKRGNSTYFPGFVAPMLPKKLSHGLCSLNPHQDRLAFVVEALISPDGKLLESKFYEAVIKSKARLTYGEVQEVIDQTEEGGYERENQTQKFISSSLEKVILNLELLTNILMEERNLRGALNLEIPETEVEVDESGKPLDVVQAKRLFSHCLVEECMVLANRTVAQYLEKKKICFLSRVHEPPKLENIEDLDFFLKAFGFPRGFKKLALKSSKETSVSKIEKKREKFKEKPNKKEKKFLKEKREKKDTQALVSHVGDLQRSINSAISYFSNTHRGAIFSLLVLRSLSQAKYDVSDIGHFGLNLKYYTHFTSPIRRYSDITVHRALKEILSKGSTGLSDSAVASGWNLKKSNLVSNSSNSKASWFIKKSFEDKVLSNEEGVKNKPYPKLFKKALLEELKTKGVHLSACEQRSIKAERQIVSIKKARFLEKYLGESFDGMISSVKRFGVFVLLKDFDVDGLIHIEDLKGGYLEYDERELKLYSFKTGVVYAIGDFLRVQVAKVNIEDGKINFLLSN